MNSITSITSKIKPSRATIRKLLNLYHDTKRYTISYWPHILIVLLTIYLLTSLSFTTVESFQNREEKNNEIRLPLTYDPHTKRFIAMITFYENNKKTPIRLHVNLGTIYTSIVESSVNYCVTPHAKYYEIPCNEKCHSIYGAKCSNSNFPITDKLNINKKLLKVIKTCNKGRKVDNLCGTVRDENHSRWAKVYETSSKIQLSDKIFHNKIYIDIISKLFSQKDIDRNWNILGLGYPDKNDKLSILYQLNIKMFTITDNPDTNKSELIFNPRFAYFKDPDIRTSFYTQMDKRYHLINAISIKTPNKSSTQPEHLAYTNPYPLGYIGKIYLTTSVTDIVVNHQMKVTLLEIFRILNLLTREEDDNAFTHFKKPLVINHNPDLFPILNFTFHSPDAAPETITLRPRNYIKQLLPNQNKAVTHFIAKENSKDIVFGMPFFKYRATTFNDETTTLFIKELDLHKPHQKGSKLISNPNSDPLNNKPVSANTLPKPKSSIFPKKMIRKVRKPRQKRRPVNIRLNYA